MPNIIAVIPARYASTRFSGKPLADILGKPMIRWVYENAMSSKLVNKVFVATDDERIFDIVKNFGGNAIITPKEIQTGTDRIAYAVRDLDADIIVNIQGDEPLISGEMIDSAIEPFLNENDIDISTLAVKINDVENLFNPNVVKVILNKDNFALYFSRSPIPFCRDAQTNEEWLKTGIHYKHIGIYVYRKDSLLKFVELKRSKLEEAEKLEQLRALENGMKIKVVLIDKDTIGVDTPEDLEKVIRILKQNKLQNNG
ncbi:3-deoxy-manno-octulosonate cytidylyltransferase [Candidatus Kryptobacter tengchongensis]|uniref:3-deoxy-manno-octulosonate cytidylyltransferase n=1 Tax=Kryptobacter tengchongensis TaxID=1643429 RepID=UPI0007073FB2|nr:3-deoxy-manno-octulosonate cytidylyltransferase [Candidatus Kryptobacter tengchongensis]CUS79780.1 3-deoxy-manno-octulosonate cytidylyltransferase (CMP-KDO synthetase) [Candidatus Kryptobacter tengchongensis]